jgi:urea transporter
VSQLLLDTSFTGVGQVIFLNSGLSGKILLASLALGDPFTASMAALGTATSSATSHYSGLDASTTANGLNSYNGCLVGCAAAVFLAPSSLFAISAFTVVGAASSTFVTASLSKALTPMPQWTFAFNLVTLTALLRVQPLAPATTPPVSAAVFDDAVTAVLVTAAPSASGLLLAPLTGLSQIFVVESALAGAGIVAAIASYSPLLAAHAVTGSITGSLVGGLFMGAPASEIAAGLWGFNPALTSLGVAVFFERNQQSTALSVAGAAATAAVFGALQTVFSAAATPCLTLPFCVTMSACWLLGSSSTAKVALVPGLILASNPHSPEKNDPST